jgi:hypothetical protein
MTTVADKLYVKIKNNYSQKARTYQILADEFQ